MALPSPIAHPDRIAPVCQVACINTELVQRVAPSLVRTDGVAAMFKALADDTRVKVIYALSQAELCVCDVAHLLGSSKATASYHLRLLHHLGLATYRRHGKLVYYRLGDPHIGTLVREAIEHLNGVSGTS